LDDTEWAMNNWYGNNWGWWWFWLGNEQLVGNWGMNNWGWMELWLGMNFGDEQVVGIIGTETMVWK
jgi:hypothetical protein